MDVVIKSMASLLQPLDIFQNSFFMEIMNVVSCVGCKATNQSIGIISELS